MYFRPDNPIDNDRLGVHFVTMFSECFFFQTRVDIL